MVRIYAFLRPHKLEEVKAALADLGVTGMSVSDVRGCGNSPELPSVLSREHRVIALPIRTKISMVVLDELVEQAVDTIVKCARTGEPGDGKIFVEPVLDAIRLRTLERGDVAL